MNIWDSWAPARRRIFSTSEYLQRHYITASLYTGPRYGTSCSSLILWSPADRNQCSQVGEVGGLALLRCSHMFGVEYV